MKLDIRTPIGGMFFLDGLILVGYGAFGNPNLGQTQGTNINLLWGIAMTLFGGTMLAFALRARKADATGGAPPASTTAGGHRH
jgi:uncharacterized membrane protein YgdD (TMEM256/DUF423 family)